MSGGPMDGRVRMAEDTGQFMATTQVGDSDETEHTNSDIVAFDCHLRGGAARGGQQWVAVCAARRHTSGCGGGRSDTPPSLGGRWLRFELTGSRWNVNNKTYQMAADRPAPKL